MPDNKCVVIQEGQGLRLRMKDGRQFNVDFFGCTEDREGKIKSPTKLGMTVINNLTQSPKTGLLSFMDIYMDFDEKAEKRVTGL